MAVTDADHTRVGSALGFVYQFDRATYRLLEADQNVVSVSVEHIDDVGVHRADGVNVREQDKSSIYDSARPLTNKSAALWKTLSIWSEVATSSPETIELCEFHLVTNGEVAKDSLAARIGLADTDADAAKLAEEIFELAKSVREDLKPYADKIAATSPPLLTSIVKRVFVLDHMAASFGGNLDTLPRLSFFTPSQRRALFDSACGWVKRSIRDSAARGEPTILSRREFESEMRGVARRLQAAPLALLLHPRDLSLDPSEYQTRGFYQQLDWIDVDIEFVRECVIHYAQAMATRVSWTDSDAISEESLLAYESDLKLRWSLQMRKQKSKGQADPMVQGQDLLTATLDQDSSIDGQVLPRAFTCGNFHALADFEGDREPQIGWHPDFATKAKKGGSGL